MVSLWLPAAIWLGNFRLAVWVCSSGVTVAAAPFSSVTLPSVRPASFSTIVSVGWRTSSVIVSWPVSARVFRSGTMSIV